MLEPQKILKQKLLKWLPWIITTILCIVFIYQFGINKMVSDIKSKSYQEGFSAGTQDVQNFIANQLQQQGFLKIKLNQDEQGQEQFLILRPSSE